MSALQGCKRRPDLRPEENTLTTPEITHPETKRKRAGSRTKNNMTRENKMTDLGVDGQVEVYASSFRIQLRDAMRDESVSPQAPLSVLPSDSLAHLM